MHCRFLTAPEIVKNRKKSLSDTDFTTCCSFVHIYVSVSAFRFCLRNKHFIQADQQPIRRVSAGHLSSLNDGVTIVSVSHVLSVINVSLYPEPQ